MAKVQVVGLTKVLRNLNIQLAKIEGGTAKGLYAASTEVMNEADTVVPIDQGILRNSSFNRAADSEGLTRELGYTAKYAGYVHEAPPGTNFRRPSAERKWFEKTIYNMQRQIVIIIQKFARVK